MKNKKRFPIKFIIIDIFLIFCVTVLLYQFYQSKKLEKNLEQVRIQSQINQEERRKQEEQERLERQKEQEELARQEQERLEEIKKSLPTKFNMRDKIKITAENQGNKPFCTYYAEIKAREIALNYQGNYNYDFKKVYKYLQTVPDEESGNWRNTSKFLKESIGFEDNYKTNCNLETIELKNALVNGKPLPIFINPKLSTDLGGDYSNINYYARTRTCSNWIRWYKTVLVMLE